MCVRMPVADAKWNVIKLFLQKADKDGNGSLSQDEFRNGLVTLGIPEEKAAGIVEWVRSIYFLVLSFVFIFCDMYLPVMERNRQGYLRINQFERTGCMDRLRLNSIRFHANDQSTITLSYHAGAKYQFRGTFGRHLGHIPKAKSKMESLGKSI
jgi:hypothetical protein